ncbi:MAG: hypothetical protein JXR25_13220 [Pontiellaceae bacterium]|nr:hypothetical protein [Pontiellaceae bacterium]MBN2785775.1 hypothetical protein [Pontiellaceae bacterium]
MNISPTVMLIIVCFALAMHYMSQKLLLAKGWKSDDAKPYIRRLIINGGLIIVVAVVSLIIADSPYGLIGILLFIEGAVCLAFARKLSKK